MVAYRRRKMNFSEGKRSKLYFKNFLLKFFGFSHIPRLGASEILKLLRGVSVAFKQLEMLFQVDEVTLGRKQPFHSEKNFVLTFHFIRLEDKSCNTLDMSLNLIFLY